MLVELHDVLLGYGRAADALREAGVGVVGTGIHLEVTRPADPARTQDLDAALDADLLTNHVVLGPLLDGSYPVAARAASGLAEWDHVRPGDLVTTRRRLDVLAVTHSGTRTVSRGADGDRLVHAATSPGSRAADPEGLYEILCAMDNAYLGVPLLGVVPTGEGEVGHAGGLAAHAAAARRARDDGADVRGLVALGERAPGEGA
jgi:beta-glucosidase